MSKFTQTDKIAAIGALYERIKLHQKTQDLPEHELKDLIKDYNAMIKDTSSIVRNGGFQTFNKIRTANHEKVTITTSRKQRKNNKVESIGLKVTKSSSNMFIELPTSIMDIYGSDMYDTLLRHNTVSDGEFILHSIYPSVLNLKDMIMFLKGKTYNSKKLKINMCQLRFSAPDKIIMGNEDVPPVSPLENTTIGERIRGRLRLKMEYETPFKPDNLCIDHILLNDPFDLLINYLFPDLESDTKIRDEFIEYMTKKKIMKNSSTEHFILCTDEELYIAGVSVTVMIDIMNTFICGRHQLSLL